MIRIYWNTNKIIPEEFIFASSGYMEECEGVMPTKGIYSHISGIDHILCTEYKLC